jgi:hypothetical protein
MRALITKENGSLPDNLQFSPSDELSPNQSRGSRWVECCTCLLWPRVFTSLVLVVDIPAWCCRMTKTFFIKVNIAWRKWVSRCNLDGWHCRFLFVFDINKMRYEAILGRYYALCIICVKNELNNSFKLEIMLYFLLEHKNWKENSINCTTIFYMSLWRVAVSLIESSFAFHIRNSLVCFLKTKIIVS